MPPNTWIVSSRGVPEKPTKVALGNASWRNWANPLCSETIFFSLSTLIVRPKLIWVRWASSLKQIIFERSDKRPVSSQNFWTVVIKTPPLCLTDNSFFKSSLLAIALIDWSPRKSVAAINCLPVWVSKSSRSTTMRMVGLRFVRLANCLARKSIVIVFPQPVAPKYVPPLPSPPSFVFKCARILS